MTAEPERGGRSARGETISANALYAFLAQLGTAAFTAALTIFLSRELGPSGYGTFALALSITGLLIRASSGATSQAVARYVAERHGRTEEITGVLGMALRIRFATAAAIAAALFVLAGPIADLYNTPDLAWPLRGVSLAFLGQSLVNFIYTVFVALRKAQVSTVLYVSESAMEFTASVALVLLGAGAAGAAFGRAIGYGLGALLGVILLAGVLGRSPVLRTGRSPVGRREFVNYAGAMLVVSSASAVFAQLDVLLLGAFLSTAAVGVYAAPLRLLNFLAYPGTAAAQGIAPRLARHPDHPPNVAALNRGLGYILLLQAGIATFVLVWADPIVRLTLGPEFEESAEVLRALSPFVFLLGVAPLLTSPLNYAGEGRRRIPVAIATVVLAVVLDVILIPTIGILGAALGTTVAYSLYVGGHFWLAHRTFGLDLRALALAAARALAAGAGMAAVLLALGTGRLSALAWIAGLIGGGAAFVTILIVTRAVSLDELAGLVRLGGRALRGR